MVPPQKLVSCFRDNRSGSNHGSATTSLAQDLGRGLERVASPASQRIPSSQVGGGRDDSRIALAPMFFTKVPDVLINLVGFPTSSNHIIHTIR